MKYIINFHPADEGAMYNVYIDYIPLRLIG